MMACSSIDNLVEVTSSVDKSGVLFSVVLEKRGKCGYRLGGIISSGDGAKLRDRQFLEDSGVDFLRILDVMRLKSCFAAPACWSGDGGDILSERNGLDGDTES
jgi:hypothetical protein